MELLSYFLLQVTILKLALGNKHLNILKGMKLLCAPELILYVALVYLWIALDINFVNNTDLMLLRNTFYPHHIIIPVVLFHHSWACSTLLVYFTQHLGLPVHLLPLWGPANYLKVGCLCHIPHISFCMQGTYRVGALFCNICTCQCVEPHALAFGCSARWHQGLWIPWYYLACFFVPFAPLFFMPRLAHAH